MSSERPDDPGGDPLAWLLRTAHTLPPDQLPRAAAEALAPLGARSSCVYLVDHDHTVLHPAGPDTGGRETMAVDGTTGGRAFSLERTVVAQVDGAAQVWLPLIDGTARFGVVLVDLPGGEPDDAAVRRLEALASLLAELYVAKGQYTDVVEHVRRRRRMSLAAELQRANLPPVALVTARVAVAGMLIPAYEVAGDSFDYALNSGALDVAVIDSVGHDTVSSLVSHLVQGSLRNSRRSGVDLIEAYAAADTAVTAVFRDLRFATAVFGRLDLDSCRFEWVCAGHPRPLLFRNGRVIGELDAVAAPPIGLGAGPPLLNEAALEPGDSLVIYTDGVTEGGVRGEERFGIDRLTDLMTRVIVDSLPPAERVRRLLNAVFEHSAYRLRDDTTIVLVQLGES